MGDQTNNRTMPAIWRIFASMRLGLVLMFLLAGAATLGVLLPLGISSQGEVFGQIVQAIGLNRVFSTWWFKGIALLLAVNILVCLVYRIRAVIYVLRFPRMTVGSMDRLKYYETFFAREKAEEIAGQTTQVLLANRYRVLQSGDEEQVLIYADKQRFAIVGPVLAHIGALVLFAGILWSSSSSMQGTFITGTQEDPFKLATLGGRLTDQEKTLSLKAVDVKLISPASGVRDLKGTLELYQNGQMEKTGEISYGVPFINSNANFHLLYNVPTVLISTNNNGQQDVKLIRPTENETSILVPNSNPPMYISFSILRPGTSPQVTYTVVEYTPSPNPGAAVHEMRAGEQVQLINYPAFSFSLVGYEDALKLRFTEDKGIGLVLAGALILLLGMCVSLFLHYRKVWVNLIPDCEQVQVMVGGYTSRHRVNFSSEFSGLVEEIKS